MPDSLTAGTAAAAPGEATAASPGRPPTHAATLTYDDGACVPVRAWVPPQARQVFLVSPALAVRAAYYEPLAAALHDAGLGCVLADQRGLGDSSVRVRPGVSADGRRSPGADFGYPRLADDLAAQLAFARAFDARAELIPLGHSLGGQIVTVAAARHPAAFARAALVAAGTPFARNFPGLDGAKVWALIGAAQLAPALGYFPGKRIGFGGDEAPTLMRQWSRLAARGEFPASAFGGAARAAGAGKAVLAVSLERDWMAPPAALDHLLSLLAPGALTRRHVGAAELGADALDHLRWARRPAGMVRLLAAWAADTLTDGAPPPRPAAATPP